LSVQPVVFLLWGRAVPVCYVIGRGGEGPGLPKGEIGIPGHLISSTRKKPIIEPLKNLGRDRKTASGEVGFGVKGWANRASPAKVV